MSILFVDLVDFTPYVESVDPELVRRMQTGFFAAVRQVVRQYGGVVEKYIGDAVMALFGAPIATETDALRCVRAGLELQRALSRLADRDTDGRGDEARHRTDRVPASALRFRVGVATGEALVDVAAARDGGQAIVAGDVVNTASRLQSQAPPGGVIVCGNTHHLTANAIRYEQLPPVTLRGRSSPTQVWLARAAVRRRQPDRDLDSTPLVDREHELSLLVNALHRSIRDRVPQVITLFGPAGIGKSRLVRELFRYAERLSDQTVSWRAGRCPPFGENVTFAALADIVKSEAGILDTDTAEVAQERLAAAVGELVEPAGADRLIEALRPLVGLPGRLPADETESAWRRFLIALAARRPTVLLFEDLHWADETMLRFVELLGASVRDVPLLVLCTARPELISREPSTGIISGSLAITLPPLREPAVATLLAQIIGQATLPTRALTALIEVSGGNPLYAQEYVRMLVEQGALKRDWPAGRPLDLPMPDSVHAVIANRVDLLDAHDRAVLCAAAVVGVQFWPGAVAAALNHPTDAVESALRRLEQRDFLQLESATSMAGEPEFQFRHVLVRDVCYQRLPRTERVARHGRTADWLDARSRDRDTDLAEVIAHHRWAAHEIGRTLGVDTGRLARIAREALNRAAQRAYALHALDAAAAHTKRALTLCDDTDLPGRLRLELLDTEIAFRRDGAALLTDGGVRQLTALAERLLDLGDRASSARAWTLLGQAAWLNADRPAASSSLEQAVKLFETLPDTAAKADAYAELGRLHMLSYERDAAITAAGAAVAIAERLGLVEVRVDAEITVAMARYQAGDAAGLDMLHGLTDFCRAHQLLALPRAVQNLAYALREEGDWIGSDELLTERKDNLGRALTTGYSGEAMRAYFEGNFDRLLAAADAFVDTPAGRWDVQVRGLRAVLRLLRGDEICRRWRAPDEHAPQPMRGGDQADGHRPSVDRDRRSRDEVTDALEVARGSGFHRMRWTMLGLGALCRALQGRAAEALSLLDELAESWCRTPALASGEWVAAAAYAAALAGRDAAVRVHDMLARVPHVTAWTKAACHTVTAALSAADGDHTHAARSYSAAAAVYAAIPDQTDRMIALALTVREQRSAALAEAATAEMAEVRAFALRNHAPGLLRLTAAEPT